MTARAARIGLWLAAIFVVLVLGGWMLLPLFVSSELVRNGIERELADITGRQIRVGGRVDVDLFPSPVASLYDLHVLGDAPLGEQAGDVLTVERVEVAIPLSSLLARDPAFSQFKLIRPTLKMTVDGGQQVANSGFGGRLGRAVAGLRAETEGEETEVAAPDMTRLGRARLGTATVENGSIEFVGPLAISSEKVTGINGVVSWPRAADKFSATLKGIWRGTAFEQKIDVDQALHFLAGEITNVKLSFASDTLTYSFDGKMGGKPTAFAEGAVSLSTPSLRQALDWLQLGVEPGHSIGAIALKGTIRGDPRKVRFENLSLTLPGSTGMGVMEFAFRDNARPAVTATLDFAQMDIVSFLSAFTGLPASTQALDQPVSTAVLDQLDVDLRLSAKAANAGPLQLTDIAAVTQIKNGSAVFEMPDATAYGGKVQAHLKLQHEAGPMSAEFGVGVSDVNSAAVADALAIGGLFPRGIAAGNLNVTAPLTTWGDLLSRASGKAELRVINGLINGVGFQTLGSSEEPKSFFRLQDKAQTSDVFTAMSVEALIQDGVFIVNGGTVDYPAGSVQLNGVIPYWSSSIALTTIAQAKSADGNAPIVQHFIGGSWSNPYATPVLLPRAE